MRLDGKVALISGGAKGQGASHGKVFACHGARVVLGDILEELGEKLAAELRRESYDVVFTHLDVTSPEDWERAVAFAEDTYGRLDVLVNNAGIFGVGSVVDVSLEEWQRVIAVNQTGALLGMRESVPALRRAGGGSIINVSSVLGISGTAASIAYHATKAAIRIMTRSAALTLASDSIRVNCVVPGLVLTDFISDIDQTALDNRLASYPLRRAATPEEISHAVLYLASDESSYVTGSDLVIDGGALSGWVGRHSVNDEPR